MPLRNQIELHGPGPVSMQAFREFQSWTKLVLRDAAPLLRITRVGWDSDKSCSVVRYAGVPKGRPTEHSPEYAVLVESIARLVSIRSRRRDHTTGDLKPIPGSWRTTLRDSFAPMYKRAGSLEISDGWFDLLLTMSDWIWSVDADHAMSFDQIKSKYGGLRGYHSTLDDAIEDIVESFEGLSEHCCETCGAPGKIRGKGWITALCDEHASVEQE
ncbi:MAG TPA: hypothetical protein VIL30_24725 [Ramlibacter sp.]|jgi:hypothetical protein